MKVEKEERWKELREQVTAEQDAQKLAALIEDIKRLLEAKKERVKDDPPSE
jgi:hypothetical protein